MNLLKNSRYTLSANIINQISAMLVFLTIPNILSEGDYAQTVYISVLVSFLILSDFGMSFVYARTMPSIYHKSSKEIIEEYNQTFFWFRIFMSIVGSIVIAIVYYLKYEIFLNAVLLVFINPLVIIVTFFIQQHSVREDFLTYRDINIKNSIAKILIIPMSYLFGLSGWFTSQLLSSLVVIKSIKHKVLFGFDRFNIKLIKEHFFEAIILLGIFFFWSQLLNSGRLFASIYYDDIIIAQYGITNAGYALLLSLIISIFLPVTVATLKIMRDDTKNAIEELYSIIIKVSLALFVVVVLAIEFSPYLFEIFFPKYNIDFNILKYQLLSLISMPIVCTLGNVFIGMKEPIKLMLIYITSFIVSLLVFRFIDMGIQSAAFAQLVGVTFMGVSLFVATLFFYARYIESKFKKSLMVFLLVYFPYIIYLLIRNNI